MASRAVFVSWTDDVCGSVGECADDAATFVAEHPLASGAAVGAAGAASYALSRTRGNATAMTEEELAPRLKKAAADLQQSLSEAQVTGSPAMRERCQALALQEASELKSLIRLLPSSEQFAALARYGCQL